MSSQRQPSYQMDKQLLTLNDLKPGQSAHVIELSGKEDLVERLMVLGLVPNAFVRLAYEAPFGKDPIAIEVCGSLLALRRSEAAGVRVQV